MSFFSALKCKLGYVKHFNTNYVLVTRQNSKLLRIFDRNILIFVIAMLVLLWKDFQFLKKFKKLSMDGSSFENWSDMKETQKVKSAAMKNESKWNLETCDGM